MAESPCIEQGTEAPAPCYRGTASAHSATRAERRLDRAGQTGSQTCGLATGGNKPVWWKLTGKRKYSLVVRLSSFAIHSY